MFLGVETLIFELYGLDYPICSMSLPSKMCPVFARQLCRAKHKVQAPLQREGLVPKPGNNYVHLVASYQWRQIMGSILANACGVGFSTIHVGVSYITLLSQLSGHYHKFDLQSLVLAKFNLIFCLN